MQRPRVAVVVEHYLPGFMAGGPMRSVSALVEQLGEEFDFRVMTRDRDAGDVESYQGIRAGKWQPLGKGQVRYLAPHELSMWRLIAHIHDIRPDAVYLNSFFAPMSMRLVTARRLGFLRGIPILLAPRGELSPGAMALKTFKKRSVIRLSVWAGLHRDVVYHASTGRERDEILRALPSATVPTIARNPVASVHTPLERRAKRVGAARFVFLSRITRKKNLHIAVDLLRSVKGCVTFDIYGPVINTADHMYWHECETLIGKLPPNVTATYRGPVPHDCVAATLMSHEFFLFPTAGENFGHAIVEALLAGCPIVTSDQTPWNELTQSGAGWDLPLTDMDAWRRRAQFCVDMDTRSYETASESARALGLRIASRDTASENRRLLHCVLQRGGSPGK